MLGIGSGSFDPERWSRFAGQFGGLANVDSGFDYAANFSSFACLA
jgi:hypothetical protein